MNNIRKVDLNLLMTLHALLDERHVSRAALRLHKSQPAVSHALAHLREIFDDQLLVRRSGKLVPTARAQELAQPLADALAQLGSLLSPPKFDPAQTRRTFRLAMSDYGARVLLPKLTRALREIAPGIDLIVNQASRETMLMQAVDGDIDLALGVFPDLKDEVRAKTLFTESFACIADRANLPESGGLDLEGWLQRPHALVAMRGGMDNEIDRVLAAMGRQRRCAIILPHWSVASDLIAGTDLILTVAKRSLDAVADDPRLRIFDPPIAIQPFAYQLIWHQRHDIDASHRWLREQIHQAAGGQDSSPDESDLETDDDELLLYAEG